MKRNIVYILGAGFSAPARIPTMSEFLEAARNIRQDNPGDGKYSYFGKVLDQFDSPTRILPYYNTNTFNIEEILSILEMESLITSKPGKTKVFEDFIADVIEYYAQPLTVNRINPLLENLQQRASGNPLVDLYVPFVLAIFNQDLVLNGDIREPAHKISSVLTTVTNESNKNRYSIVTLNYDVLLERALSYLNQYFQPEDRLSWADLTKDTSGSYNGVVLAHLHGNTDDRNIISPTWNKSHIGSKDKEELFLHWRAAHNVLREANEIRFLGYSLPESDSYIKYLLKSAGLGCKNLQKISAITRDSDGSTEKRYMDLFNNGRFRFADSDLTAYMRACGPRNTISTMHEKPLPLPWSMMFGGLEDVHEKVLADAQK